MENVVYIDEYQRDRWLLKLQVAREAGGVAVFNADLGQDAQIIQFPTQEDIPDGAA